METLQIEKTNALTAYNKADASGKKLLADLLGEKTFQKITERVKTFEDALAVLGEQPANVNTLLAYNGIDGDMIAAQAFMKLNLIARALNEGWQPDWKNSSQYKYYPWFKANSAGSGLSCDDYDNWFSGTHVGSRLCYRNSDLAEYAGTQFIDLYNDFLTIK